MKTSLLQKRSHGIAGTLANANHHAQKILPLINRMQAYLEDPMTVSPNDLEWVQGHNVHLLKTEGRTFVLRPLFESDWGYSGLVFCLRASRTLEVQLASVRCFDNMIEQNQFFAMVDYILNSYRKDDRRDKSGD